MGCARTITHPPIHQPARAGGECPAETIALQLARIEDRLAQLDDENDDSLSAVERFKNEALQAQLRPALQALSRQLEYTPPRSLAGVCGLLLQMSDPVTNLEFDGATPRESAAELARFGRLHRLAVEALVELAGLDREALGVRHFVYGAEGHAAALEVISTKAA